MQGHNILHILWIILRISKIDMKLFILKFNYDLWYKKKKKKTDTNRHYHIREKRTFLYVYYSIYNNFFGGKEGALCNLMKEYLKVLVTSTTRLADKQPIIP